MIDEALPMGPLKETSDRRLLASTGCRLEKGVIGKEGTQVISRQVLKYRRTVGQPLLQVDSVGLDRLRRTIGICRSVKNRWMASWEPTSKT